MTNLFSKQESTQAYLKAGIMGFAGSGKTYTANEIAMGLIKHAKSLGLPEGERPIFFLDTETGSDYIANRVKESGLDIFTAKTRAFKDLIPAIKEAEKAAGVMIIDSITHFWREFTEAYAKRKNRTSLQFQDWNFLKTEWGKFTDIYINSSAHIILCGRAGYEYDYFEDDDGKKQLEKTGIKMKAETEMGYEPSLLILMEREMEMETKKVYREAHVLKERFGIIDGRSFKNPTFDNFMPHISALNLGGKQLGIDTSRTSEEMIDPGQDSWPQEKRQREIWCEEIEGLLVKHYPGQGAKEKAEKIAIIEQIFGTRSWTKVANMRSEQIKEGYNKMCDLFLIKTEKEMSEQYISGEALNIEKVARRAVPVQKIDDEFVKDMDTAQ